MAKGGARANSGPAPDPEALRRDRPADAAGWVSLPAVGRQGKLPGWPLSEAVPRELEVWKREWVRPQAVVWERNGQEVEVALYVRSLVVAEEPEASTAARTLVRQQMEALGISIPGLLRNHWRIEAFAPQEEKAATSSARSRLRDASADAA